MANAGEICPGSRLFLFTNQLEQVFVLKTMGIGFKARGYANRSFVRVTFHDWCQTHCVAPEGAWADYFTPTHGFAVG